MLVGGPKVENLKCFWNIQICIFLICGWRGSNTHLLKTDKNLHFLSGSLRTYHTYYNVSSSNSYQGMDPRLCLRGLYTKDGRSNIYLLKTGIKKLHFFSLWWWCGGVPKVEYLKIFWNIQICIFLICWGSKIYLLKTEIKNAFFSHGGGPKVENLKIFWNIQICIFLIGGVSHLLM